MIFRFFSSRAEPAAPPVAPQLATELREAINRWFAAEYHGVHEQRIILDALGDLLVEQIGANPAFDTQRDLLNGLLQDVCNALNAANSRQAREMGIVAPFQITRQ